VTTADGGMNTACESCLNTSCGNEQCLCVTDSNTLPVDDAGDVAPGCDLFVNCVYGDLTSILANNPDAGASTAVMTAIADCSGGDAGSTFAAGSITAGTNLITCVATMCNTQCVP